MEKTSEKNFEEELKEPNDGQPKKKNAALKYILNIVFVLVVTVVSVIIAVAGQFDDIISILSGADIKWIFFIIGLIAVAFSVRSLILFFFARLYTRQYHFHQALANDQVGVFYSAVTPGATGGQIMQAYTYKKQGVQISNAVSILAMYSIVYQVILILYGVVSFIVKYDFINALGNIPTGIAIQGNEIILPIWPLTIIGFILNVGVILGVLLMAYWHGFHNFIMGPVISLLTKIKLVKNPDKSRESLRIQVENFKIEFRRLLTNFPFTILVSILFIIYFGIIFSIPYFVALALGNQSVSATIWDSIFLSNYHQMVTGLIPLPGSAGVSEYFFFQLFADGTENGFFFAGAGKDSYSMCKAALLIWRSLTFTLPLIVAGFVSAFYRSSPSKEASIAKQLPNRQTFVSLQNETYIQRKGEVEIAEETMRLSRYAVMKRLKTIRKKKEKNDDDNEGGDII